VTATMPNLPPILPIGTAVVTRAEVRSGGALVCPEGSVGTIIQSPADAGHSYRVRLPGGEVVSLRRAEMAVLSHFQSDGLAQAVDAMTEHNLWDYVIYKCVVGSRAYGLDHSESDVDRRGVYLPPAEMHWSLYGVPEQLENTETDECYWELQKFLTLALKANPNVLEVLYSPLVEQVADLGQELLDMRAAFLSKLVYQTYNGYVQSQFKKMTATVRNHGQVKPKHAMHLIRLLLSGITVLRESLVPVRVDEHRDRLIAIRDGHMDWEDVDAWRLELHKEFDAAFETTNLPDQPDYDAANAFLVRARREMATRTDRRE
jgi:uncharacterized protein